MTGVVATAVASLVAMEAVSYMLHRFLMHGVGWRIHADHHSPPGRGLERNDLYPASSSLLAVGLFAAGTTVPALHQLVAAGAGVTLYGVAYLYVHELCIHRRVGGPRPRGRYVEWLARMHRIHHLYGGEPYGMLLPLVPADLRRRAAADDRDPLARRASTRLIRSRL